MRTSSFPFSVSGLHKPTLHAPRKLLAAAILPLALLAAMPQALAEKGAVPAIAQEHAQQTINVLTSYPDGVMAAFEQAFEQAHPEYQVRFLWRMPHDALPYFREHAQDGSIDVYWAASPRTFARLKSEKLLRRLDIDTSGLPATVGPTRISDPDGHYLATEMAAYVFALNPQRLRTLGIEAPATWTDLTNPRLKNEIVLPVPTGVGFAPVMFDIVLQSYGWDKGWALWSEIAALSQFANRGAGFLTDIVANDQAAIGLAIDFFVNSAIANGAALVAHYPQANGVNPAHIAFPAVSGSAEGARAFAAFVLSETGQKLLLEPDIRRLPVRPAVYRSKSAQAVQPFNPFAAADKGTLNYDGERGRPRLALIANLFEVMAVQADTEFKALWQRIHDAEAKGQDLSQVRALLTRMPLTEAEADSAILHRLFQNNLEGGEQSQIKQAGLRQKWALFFQVQRVRAAKALEALGA